VSAKLPVLRERPHQPFNYGSPYFDPTVHAAVMAHAEYPVTAVLPTDQTTVYMSLKTAKAFGLKVPRRHRPYSGRRRGGRFPRWRWGRSRWQDPNHCQQCFAAQGSAWVLLAPDDSPHPWLAEVMLGMRGHIQMFARRCDAKRWCERMMAKGSRP